MTTYDVIDKKKKKGKLTQKEIEYMINGYVENEIPDYQISAWLMAIYFNGMDDEELLYLTKCMADSGVNVDLSEIQGIKVDKHSTGGVGDKVTLVVAPIVAACGGKVAKMSGRGLGFSGGTIDKLEAIPGLSTSMSEEKFFELVNKNGLAVMGQTSSIAPADKKLYALRDVTATVDSIPLIASSIMSKKIAAGSDKIVLEVTVGSGAFMKEIPQAVELAKKMVAIGEQAGRETVAFITNMDVPLGCAVGNNNEVIEAIETLKGNGPEDVTNICKEIALSMLVLGEIGPEDQCKKMIQEVIDNGDALKKFAMMIESQGGNSEYIYDTSKWEKPAYEAELICDYNGYIQKIDTEQVGKTSVLLGAGRKTKDDVIDSTAGIYIYKKTGDAVKKGDILAKVIGKNKDSIQKGIESLELAYSFGQEKVEKQKDIIAYITKKDVSE